MISGGMIGSREYIREGLPPLERCLACEAEGSPPLERCLACEAVVNREYRDLPPFQPCALCHATVVIPCQT
jgi:hypothetical protein